MSSVNVKRFTGIALLAAASATACSSPVSPSRPTTGPTAVHDSVSDSDTTDYCRTGWTIVGGRWTCHHGG